jgi:hypothetical protein
LTSQRKDVEASATHLRVLFVEDSDTDVQLCLRQLRRGGYDVENERVQTREELATALRNDWDLVVSDYNLPRFRGDQALEMVRAVKGPDLWKSCVAFAPTKGRNCFRWWSSPLPESSEICSRGIAPVPTVMSSSRWTRPSLPKQCASWASTGSFATNLPPRRPADSQNR